MTLTDMFGSIGLTGVCVLGCLVLLSLYSVAVIVDKLRRFRVASSQSAEFLVEFDQCLRKGRLQSAVVTAQRHEGSHVARVVAAGVTEMIESDGPVDDPEVRVPLVDVVLVLLIIFMIIAPLTLRGYDVSIPSEAALDPAAPKQPQVHLAIDPADCPLVEPLHAEGLPVDCTVRIDDRTHPVAEMPSRIAEIFSSREPTNRVLFVAAADELNYEAVMRIMDSARSGIAGLRIALVGVGSSEGVSAESAGTRTAFPRALEPNDG